MKYPLFPLFLLFLLMVACGSEREIEPKTPPPVPAPKPKPDDDDDRKITFQDVQALTGQYCVRCHSTSQFLKSEPAWRASEAKQRVGNGSMPQPGTNEARTITTAERAVLVNF